MKKTFQASCIALIATGIMLPAFAAAPEKKAPTGQPADPGWPREFRKNGQTVTIYQPQIDSWDDYTKLHYRAAISLKPVSGKKEIYGVVEGDAQTVVDRETRNVALMRSGYQLRFPNLKGDETSAAEKIVRHTLPESNSMVISLDRLLAMLNPAKEPLQRSVEVSVDPPKIFYSPKPAILVMFMGAPQFKPVDKDKPDLLFAVNTNWDAFFDTTESRYYLLNGQSWLTATDPVKGPWTATQKLPAGLSKLPPNDNWSDVIKNIPGKPAKEVPTVFASTEPAEMIVTNGDPAYAPITGTKLMRVTNTESTLFLNSADKQFYFLVAGRWFRAVNLSGPWSTASNDLSADFASIPDSNPTAFVKASVPGTEEAKDAVLLASVPKPTTVSIAKPALQVSYDGQPKFVAIKGTNVQYATNSPLAVFLVGGGYYCCNKGIWYCGGTANGPWVYCTSVPKDIYAIPPNHPMHNVTYVTVQSSTPTTVTYVQTSGYSGEYVAANGVLMFGAGLLVGALIANNNDCYYCYPAPYYYSYGCGAHYHYGYGGYYAGAHYYGPYGGAGRYAAYNPYTGTYSRGAGIYGPAGSATVRQAYNPYSDTYAARASVNTRYGSSGRFYAEQGNKSVWGGHESGVRGTVGWAESSKGGQAAAWDTAKGQGAVAKDKNGNVYVANDGNVYKKQEGGGWSQNNGSGGWESVEKQGGRSQTQSTSASTLSSQKGTRSSTAQPSTTSTRSGQSGSAFASSASSSTIQGLESQANARQKGNRETQQVSQFQRQGSGGGFQSRGGGGRTTSRSGGGRRR